MGAGHSTTAALATETNESSAERDQDHHPVSAKQLASDLPVEAWKTVSWRAGTQQKLRSRFAAVRVRPAHRDYWQAEPNAEEWLLIEWPKGESESAKYLLSTLSAATKLKDLVAIAKQRWIMERDYEESKQETRTGPRSSISRMLQKPEPIGDARGSESVLEIAEQPGSASASGP